MARNIKKTSSGQKGGRKKKRDAITSADFINPKMVSPEKNSKEPSETIIVVNLTEIRDVPREIITITPDILQNHLNKYAKTMARKRPVVMPLTLILMFLIALITSKFQDAFGIHASFWYAVCCLGLIISIVLLVWFVSERIWAATHNLDIITEIKNESKKSSKEELWTIQKLVKKKY